MADIPIPPPSQPVIGGRPVGALDQRRGGPSLPSAATIEPTWYRFLEDLARRVKELEES